MMKPSAGQSIRCALARFTAAVLLIVALAPLAARAAAPAGPAPEFFPTPQKAQWKGEAAAAKAFTIKTDGKVPFRIVNEYETLLREWGFEQKDGGVALSLAWLPAKDCESAAIKPHQKKTLLDYPEFQTYFLSVGDSAVSVKACGEDGFFYAIQTFRNLYRDADSGIVLTKAEITDFPSFPVRGIFEGAYGVWDDEGRLAAIDWMGRAKINSYMYGPKGDPKVRRSWRALYDEFEMFNFKRILDRCNKNHIQFGYVIAPPMGIGYASDADFEALMRKVRQLQGLGVRYFILAFDDSLGMMYNAADREQFANLGEAEAFLSNRLLQAVRTYDPDVTLVMVPEIYSGVWPMDYTNSLAAKLDPDIYIGWTGSEIGAPKIDAADMKKFIDFYKRQPSLGDNWGALFPLLGRAADLHEHTTQFTVNPYNLFGEIPIPGVGGASEPAMCQIECASAAEFAWNSAAHDPDGIVNRLARIHFKPEYRDAFTFLMYKDLMHFRAYYPLETDYVAPLDKAWQALIDKGGAADAKKQLNETAAYLAAVQAHLGDIAAGAVDPDIGKSMAVRADVSGAYLQKLLAALDNVRTNLNDGAWKQGAKQFLAALKGEDK